MALAGTRPSGKLGENTMQSRRAGLLVELALITSASFVIGLPGCGGSPWQPFEQLQIDHPLPSRENLPPGAIRDDLGVSYTQMVKDETHLPGRATAILMRALRNDQGKVVAKSYTYLSMAHQILFLTGEYRYILEMEIPKESFRIPETTWSPSEEVVFLAKISPLAPHLLDREAVASKEGRAAAVTTATAPGREAETETPSSLGEAAAALRDRIALFRQARQRAKEVTTRDRTIQAQLEAVAVSHVLQVLALGQPLPRKPASSRKPESSAMSEGANLPEHILFTKILLDSGPGSSHLRKVSDPGAVGPLLRMFSDVGNARLVELLSDPNAFKRATEDGHDWRRNTLGGVAFRVRNTGARRIRVEVTGSLIRDPLFFALCGGRL